MLPYQSRWQRDSRPSPLSSQHRLWFFNHLPLALQCLVVIELLQTVRCEERLDELEEDIPHLRKAVREVDGRQRDDFHIPRSYMHRHRDTGGLEEYSLCCREEVNDCLKGPT